MTDAPEIIFALRKAANALAALPAHKALAAELTELAKRLDYIAVPKHRRKQGRSAVQYSVTHADGRVDIHSRQSLATLLGLAPASIPVLLCRAKGVLHRTVDDGLSSTIRIETVKPVPRG